MAFWIKLLVTEALFLAQSVNFATVHYQVFPKYKFKFIEQLFFKALKDLLICYHNLFCA